MSPWSVVLSQIRKGTTVKSLCGNISTDLLRNFNYAQGMLISPEFPASLTATNLLSDLRRFFFTLVWDTSAKQHSPQRCGLSHNLDDEDVVQIVTKTVKQQSQDKNYSQTVQSFSDKHAKKRLEAKKQKQSRLRG